MNVEDRGTGRTTRLINSAPQNAIFVCHTERMALYARRLCHTLNRTDVTCVSIAWLKSHGYRGMQNPVVLDHYVLETTEEYELIQRLEDLGVL